ncbi:hypothetical protein RB195_021472 [Necator americanus]
MQYISRFQMLTLPFGRLLHLSYTHYCTGGQKLFTLYTTENCSLCGYFKKRLDAYHKRTKPDWNYVEKDLRTASAEIFEKYKHDVPVLVFNDNILLKHKFSGNRLEERLSDIFPK